MADKTINELTAASTMTDDDLLVLQQNGIAKKLSGKSLGSYVSSAAEAKVNELNTAIDNKISEVQQAIDDAETDINSIITVVQNMTDLGTDTTLTTSGMAADAKATGDEVNDLKSAIGSEVLELDNSILLPIQYASLDSGLAIIFNAPETSFGNSRTTSLIPLPVTIDGKITHNGRGYNNYRTIVFYDSNKVAISGIESENENLKTNDIPDSAAFFRLSYRGDTEDFQFIVRFNVSASDKTQYLLKLMRLDRDLYLHDFGIEDLFLFPHIVISTSTGDATYSAASNYSATDFIPLPENISPAKIGSYAYTASDKARVAFYDSEKTFISAVSSNSKRLIDVTIPENAAYVRFGTHSTIPPASCLAVALISVTNSSEDIIDLIRRALV